MIDNKAFSVTSHPFFSIGITTYNRKYLLKQTLHSLQKQSFTDFEVIIGNDYLEEPLTLAMLEIEDVRFRIINNQHNLGEAENMNSMLRMAKGYYFTWQADDDLCSPVLLREVRSAIDKFDNPHVVFTSFKNIYGTGYCKFESGLNIESFLYTGKEFLRRYLSGKLKALGCWGFYDINYLQALGGMQKLTSGSIAIYSEYLLLCKTGLLPKVGYINSPLETFRVHNNSWSSTSCAYNLYMEAGINLIKECIQLFSTKELIQDFNENLSSIFKSIISSFILRSWMKNKGINGDEISKFSYLLKNEVGLLEDAKLYEGAMKNLNNAFRKTRLYVIKARLRVFLPDP